MPMERMQAQAKFAMKGITKRTTRQGDRAAWVDRFPRACRKLSVVWTACVSQRQALQSQRARYRIVGKALASRVLLRTSQSATALIPAQIPVCEAVAGVEGLASHCHYLLDIS